MFMPAVFHENLFDDLFDPFWNDGALERAMNREERETFGKRIFRCISFISKL